MIIKETITNSDEETSNLGFEFAKILKKGDFVAFYGDLGVGKTAFIRGIVKNLCPNVRVQSPTYTIVNTYKGNCDVYHFDMYRIDDEDSLYSIGFYDYLDYGGIILVEWAEKIEEYLPDVNYKISISKINNEDNKRKIVIEENK